MPLDDKSLRNIIIIGLTLLIVLILYASIPDVNVIGAILLVTLGIYALVFINRSSKDTE